MANFTGMLSADHHDSRRLQFDLRQPDSAPTARAKVICELWAAQGGRCAICGKPIDHRASMIGANRPSLDHVYPRDRTLIDRGKVRPKGLGLKERAQRNSVAAHGRCNSAKGNREPTGCELIWLLAVNARLGRERPIDSYIPVADRMGRSLHAAQYALANGYKLRAANHETLRKRAQRKRAQARKREAAACPAE